MYPEGMGDENTGKTLPKLYFSYLLRIWQTGSEEPSTWRVMLEDPHTRQTFGFESLDALFYHLQKLTAGELIDSNDPDQLAEDH